MGDYLWFAAVCLVAFVGVLVVGALSARLERRRSDERMKKTLTERRDIIENRFTFDWILRY